uniref:(northern house mosquito) hypothetical protein n=1 Tax=Culex pipiens TaxID=7175 RepID=A0A8D8L1U8_CULPI
MLRKICRFPSNQTPAGSRVGVSRSCPEWPLPVQQHGHRICRCLQWRLPNYPGRFLRKFAFWNVLVDCHRRPRLDPATDAGWTGSFYRDARGAQRCRSRVHSADVLRWWPPAASRHFRSRYSRLGWGCCRCCCHLHHWDCKRTTIWLVCAPSTFAFLHLLCSEEILLRLALRTTKATLGSRAHPHSLCCHSPRAHPGYPRNYRTDNLDYAGSYYRSARRQTVPHRRNLSSWESCCWTQLCTDYRSNYHQSRTDCRGGGPADDGSRIHAGMPAEATAGHRTDATRNPLDRGIHQPRDDQQTPIPGSNRCSRNLGRTRNRSRNNWHRTPRGTPLHCRRSTCRTPLHRNIHRIDSRPYRTVARPNPLLPSGTGIRRFASSRASTGSKSCYLPSSGGGSPCSWCCYCTVPL